MRHRLRDRASVAPNSAASRRRPVRGQRRKAATAVPAAVEAGRDVMLEAESGPDWGDTDSQAAELEALLDVEYSTDWWKESEPDSAPLADLLQHLVGCGSPLRPHELQAADSVTPSAAGRRPKSKMAAAGFPRPRVRCQDNKNAVAARLNRLRKKEYVSGLERSAARLADENQQLQKERQALGARVRELEHETRYLRAVLANDSSLSHLLGRLTGLGGVRLSTSLFLDPPSGSDHDYALPGFRQDLKIDDLEMDPEATASPCGVCLHVDKEKVSVEFCASCARKASSTAKM